MVLTLYYYEELTMKEIGLTLGVVESRVSQIHSSAVLRLRASLATLRGDNSTEGIKARASKR
jgi:RNA polymerase sigma factor for flagellar operon FliA